jgi:DNA mismatch endonuclease, patch repair protein
VVDVFSKEKRSAIMAAVKGRGNRATELELIGVFRKYRIRGWRRRSRIFGNPDFIFPTARLAVFVDGCFWHGCPIHKSLPEANRAFWKRKLDRNRTRDREVRRQLRDRGWHILRIWQHELGKPERVAHRIAQFANRGAKGAGARHGRQAESRGR